MVRTLRLHGYNTIFSIPNRLHDGYGDQDKYVEKLVKENNVGLFITVDSGISFKSLVKKIESLGAKAIITDHHLPDLDIPENVLIIDPKYNNDRFSDICGAFVALKLCWALSQYTSTPFDMNLASLAGIATVTDMMPMLDENRYLLKLTLAEIDYEKHHNKYSQLCKILFSLNGKRFLYDADTCATEDLLGFYIGPAINAVSRVTGDVTDLVNAIISCLENPKFYMPNFTDNNFTRQKMTNEMVDDATVDERENFVSAIYNADNYSYEIKGVLGLISNKLLGKYNKVALVGAAKDENTTEFSGRSVVGYNLHEGIERIRSEHPEFEISGGGHASAMGIRVRTDKLEEFKTILNEDIAANSVAYDQTIFEFEPEMADEIISTMDALKPFGTGFKKIKFQYTGILESYEFDKKLAVIDGINFRIFMSTSDAESKIGKPITIKFQPSFEVLNVPFAVIKE